LIPCVGYNPQGYRLGYGGGYYDRTLAALRLQYKGVVAIGIAWSETACNFVSSEFDICMDKMLLF
jgi:5-formyltetrahydrofolate cyclo-ligase